MLPKERLRKMQEGKRIIRERRLVEERRIKEYAIRRLEERKQKALDLHGKLLDTTPVPKEKTQEMVSWWEKEGGRNLPEFIGTMDPDEQYYEVMDYLSEPKEGFPVVARAGWRKPFTRQEADRFIDEYEPKLMELQGKNLCEFVNANSGDGMLRARC
ncbi:unnamed protein product [marine sediment metagenome]|uniref:Uncharacterized protein n=1 Tax=marine sediment metagenome TaxID=412755 RepID=X1F251_9ZZZZ